MLTALERISCTKLTEFATQFAHEMPPAHTAIFQGGLSACAGIAVVRVKQPFHLALDLAEALCSYAKKRVKGTTRPYPSALAFHRVTGSQINDDFAALICHDETTEDKEVLTAQPYRVGEHDARGVPELARLRDLKTALSADGIGAGTLRDLKTLLLTNRALADIAYGNWRRVIKGRAPQALEALDKALEKCHVKTPAIGIFTDDQTPSTPLFDALEWRMLT